MEAKFQYVTVNEQLSECQVQWPISKILFTGARSTMSSLQQLLDDSRLNSVLPISHQIPSSQDRAIGISWTIMKMLQIEIALYNEDGKMWLYYRIQSSKS